MFLIIFDLIIFFWIVFSKWPCFPSSSLPTRNLWWILVISGTCTSSSMLTAVRSLARLISLGLNPDYSGGYPTISLIKWFTHNIKKHRLLVISIISNHIPHESPWLVLYMYFRWLIPPCGVFSHDISKLCNNYINIISPKVSLFTCQQHKHCLTAASDGPSVKPQQFEL